MTKGNRGRTTKCQEPSCMGDNLSYRALKNKSTATIDTWVDEILKDIRSAKYKLTEIFINAEEEDRTRIEKIVEAISFSSDEQSIDLLLKCALYFDDLGDASFSLHVIQIALNNISENADANLRRRVHSIAGITHSRVCDFERSFSHLEYALRIARDTKNELGEFAVLCNIVSALQVIGLLSNAKDLALRLSKYPTGSPDLHLLHLQNAVNGLYLSRFTDDPVSADLFDKIARQNIGLVGSIARHWQSYVDAQHALCLIRKGNVVSASRIIKKAIREKCGKTNLRERVILGCAAAACAIALNDKKQIDLLKRSLSDILINTSRYVLHREDVLRSLIDLYSIDEVGIEQNTAANYRRMLSDHLVNKKHRQFFDRVAIFPKNQNSIQKPTYKLPRSLANSNPEQRTKDFLVGDSNCVVEQEVNYKHVPVPYIDSLHESIEIELRTPSFRIAEDWAIAADFAIDRNGRHCFEVGRLAGLMAAECGLSASESIMIEMACRLHDIGKLAISSARLNDVNLGKIDNYFVLREHAEIGAKLLSSAEGRIFQLASIVAHSHHEWWNGAGFPDGLRGQSIPFEARICFIADTFVSLLHPGTGKSAWARADAVKQISSMSGVQLDPSLLPALTTAIQSEAWQQCIDGLGQPEDRSCGELGRAKDRLISVVGL